MTRAAAAGEGSHIVRPAIDFSQWKSLISAIYFNLTNAFKFVFFPRVPCPHRETIDCYIKTKKTYVTPLTELLSLLASPTKARKTRVRRVSLSLLRVLHLNSRGAFLPIAASPALLQFHSLNANASSLRFIIFYFGFDHLRQTYSNPVRRE